MADFDIKRNDTAPALTVVLQDALGLPVDVTGATVTFKMRLATGGSLKVNGAASILDAARGVVRYAWNAADTDTAGDYYGEFQAAFGDGTVTTFPNGGINSGNLTILINPDLP